MSQEGSNQRRHPRYHTDVPVIIYEAADAVESHITQISRGGCLTLPTLPPQSNPGIKMSFRLSEQLPFINCNGEILYTIKDKGTGVAFTEISQFNKDLITEYFENSLAAEKAASS